MPQIGPKQGAKKTRKGRKIDRNRAWCVAYRNRGQREKNKLKRVLRHLSTHSGDHVAKACVERRGSRP